MHREVSTFGALDVAGTADDAFEVNERMVDVAGPFDERRATELQAQGSSISSWASQVSNVAPESFVLDGAFESSGVLAPGGVVAEGFGASVAIIRFGVNAPGEVRLRGFLEASGNGTAILELRDASGASVFARSASSGTVEFDETLPLGVGSWALYLQGGGYGRADPNASTPSAGTFHVIAEFGTASDAGTRVVEGRLSVAPNPMRHESVIRCGRGIARGTELVVHDVAGRRVRRLGPVTDGPVRWDARDDRGVPVPAGVYVIRAGDAASGRVVVGR